jgi:hypothetical protein
MPSQKFGYLNLTLRAVVVLLEARRKGFIRNQDIRRLYSLHKRSKRGDSFLRNLLKEGYLERVGHDTYILTSKSKRVIRILEDSFASDSPRAAYETVLEVLS